MGLDFLQCTVFTAPRPSEQTLRTLKGGFTVSALSHDLGFVWAKRQVIGSGQI